MSHDELNEMAAGYVLSALDSDELQRFEAHLAACPECRASVAAARPMAGGLSTMNEEAEPAAGLRERILASARAEHNRIETAGAPAPAKPAPWWRRPVLRPLPVAAVVMALAVAVAVLSVWGSQAGGDRSSVQTRLDLTYEGLEIMAQAGEWWRFDGSGITPGAAGTLAYSEELGAACLLVWGLPESDEFTYRARLTGADGSVTEHRMWRYNNAMWLILDGDPNRLQKLEVTQAAGKSLPPTDGPPLIDIPLT